MLRAGETSTPVVVLKLEHYGSLGIIRSLGRWGVAVHGIDRNPEAPGFSSKYCHGQYRWDIDSVPPATSVEYLRRLGKHIARKCLLIPTSDETTLFVAAHAAALRDYFLFPDQPLSLVESLCSKKEMFFLAKRVGIATAEAFFPQSREEVVELLNRLRFPVMLKGIDGGLLEKRTGKKMVIVPGARELLEKYDLMEDPLLPNLMIQEYIPGGDDSVWMFNGYFNAESECLFGLTGKKIRQNPVYTGMTSLGICLRNSVITETTKRFMKAIRYRGILDIGYRYDSRDGLYKVLDVNPRIGATFRLFVGKSGMDVVRALYLDLTGQPVTEDDGVEGRKWLVEDKDLRSCFRYHKDGNLTLGDWIRSLKGVKETGYFAMDDFGPFLALWKSHVKRKLTGQNQLAVNQTRVIRRLVDVEG